jgi:transcriptional regulator with XRE-family HTH domain
MPRKQLTREDRTLGEALGEEVQERRKPASAAQLAQLAEVSVDSVRKLESGGTPTPGFFLIARIASVLGSSLDELNRAARRRAGVE